MDLLIRDFDRISFNCDKGKALTCNKIYKIGTILGVSYISKQNPLVTWGIESCY
jgi:hypothetical protein